MGCREAWSAYPSRARGLVHGPPPGSEIGSKVCLAAPSPPPAGAVAEGGCPVLQTQAKIGILAGSLLAALAGVAILLRQAAPPGAEVISIADGIQ